MNKDITTNRHVSQCFVEHKMNSDYVLMKRISHFLGISNNSRQLIRWKLCKLSQHITTSRNHIGIITNTTIPYR